MVCSCGHSSQMSKGTEEKVGEREEGSSRNFWFNTSLSLKCTVEFVDLGDCLCPAGQWWQQCHLTSQLKKNNNKIKTLPSSIGLALVLHLGFDCKYRDLFMAAVLNSVTLISVFQHTLKTKHWATPLKSVAQLLCQDVRHVFRCLTGSVQRAWTKNNPK